MGYLRFVIENRRFLAFGFLLSFLASFGQTFYIAVFGGEIRAAFDLTHGEFGMAYGLGTLGAGMVFLWAGKAIDRFDLRAFAAGIAVGLAIACLVLARAENYLALVGAFFLLRLFGQGLMSHTASTSMARYFEAGRRGRAVGVSVMGFPAGEALFPGLAVLLIATIGWRQAWIGGAVVLVLVAVPLLLWLLRGHGTRHAAYLQRLEKTGAASTGQRQWSRSEVLGDWRFFVTMAALVGPGFITTGLFFHQVHLVESKGWTLAWFATGFVVFAGVKILASLATGVLVDRFGARRLAVFGLLPISLGLLVLGGFDARASALVFMALTGLNGGMGQTVMGTLWAEIYGVQHLGAIRALAFGVMVIAVAVAPALMGWLFDGGTTIAAIAFWSAGYCVAGAAVLIWLFVLRPAQPRGYTRG